jgi:solute carrier family 32 (vesicular inhibitory amino acid transporter)
VHAIEMQAQVSQARLSPGAAAPGQLRAVTLKALCLPAPQPRCFAPVAHEPAAIFLACGSRKKPWFPKFDGHKAARLKLQPCHAAAAASNEAADQPQATSTFVQAVFNVVNVMMGVGLLSLPFALNSSGWVGILLLWLMGIVTNYTGEC